MHKFSGIVIKGDGYGRTLGYPTINLSTDAMLPRPGVYCGLVYLNNKKYRAGILVNPNGKLEAHLLNYAGNAYGKEVTLEVGKFLREYKKFNSEAELIAQIEKDLEQC